MKRHLVAKVCNTNLEIGAFAADGIRVYLKQCKYAPRVDWICDTETYPGGCYTGALAAVCMHIKYGTGSWKDSLKDDQIHFGPIFTIHLM